VTTPAQLPATKSRKKPATAKKSSSKVVFITPAAGLAAIAQANETAQFSQRDSTQDRILLAAEGLFMEHGFEGTSLRAITTEAGVNLAAVNYHFGSKEELIKQLLTRRFDPLNNLRSARLTELQRAAKGMALAPEVILETLFIPALELARDKINSGGNFLRLLGRAYIDPSPYTKLLLSEQYASMIEQFKLAFCQAIPYVPRAELTLRLHFTMGALASTIAGADVFKLLASVRTAESNHLSDEAVVVRKLIPFLVAGLKAPVSH
jgi:AcrR family transcriptional regulator